MWENSNTVRLHVGSLLRELGCFFAQQLRRLALLEGQQPQSQQQQLLLRLLDTSNGRRIAGKLREPADGVGIIGRQGFA